MWTYPCPSGKERFPFYPNMNEGFGNCMVGCLAKKRTRYINKIIGLDYNNSPTQIARPFSESVSLTKPTHLIYVSCKVEGTIDLVVANIVCPKRFVVLHSFISFTKGSHSTYHPSYKCLQTLLAASQFTT